MKIVKIGKLENRAKCGCCNTELIYDKYDLKWTHTEESYYYINCPLCREKIWLRSTPELDKMYHEAYAERENNNKL